MHKALMAILVAGTVVGCTTNPSAFESGWTNDTNEKAYEACGSFRSQGHEYGSALDKVVASGALTPSQANRAIDRDVRVGDPECLAYAAYGVDREKISFRWNEHHQLMGKSVTYNCKETEVPCPGLRVTFIDGKVTSLAPL